MAARFGASLGAQRRTKRGGAFVGEMKAQMQQIIDTTQAIIDKIEVDSAEALRFALQPMSETSQVLVPKDTRKLMQSHFLEVRKIQSGVRAYIGYAKGDNPHYAFIVHERMDVRHAPPTTAKYLQIAVQNHQGEIVNRYSSFVKNSVGL